MSAADQATTPVPAPASAPQPEPEPEPAPRLKLSLPDRTEVRPRAENRLRALDGLRLLAALMVCFYHYAGKNGEVASSWHQSPADKFPTLSQMATYGSLGVQFFFLISGFVICMSSWGKSMGDFFRSRVSRLYPAYWAAIVLVTAACFVAPAVSAPLRSDEVLVNFTMLQQPMGVPRVLGVDWTLWVEVRFYALFALFVVWKGVTYRRVVMFCILWTLAGVFARVADHPLTDQLVMRDHAPYFIGGLALYLIYRFGSDLLLWGIVVFSFLLGQRYSVTALWHPGPQGAFHRNPHVIELIVLVAFVAVAAVALGWTSKANWRWLTVAGALTYPFYLIHEHLGWFFIRVLYREFGLSPYLTIATTILSMLGIAWLLHKFVEKPFGPRLRKALAAQSVRRA
ncbi:acyltransferase family protein [Streptomyces sp. NPDC020951]|uniref:acyltransferase family protein n=1 Tax=Streptomyces sp. NPDC020951 TaxID=3365104 RepID=UPI00378DCB1E